MSRFEWVAGSARLLQQTGDEFERTRPFEGMRIGTGIHLEPKTAALLLALGGRAIAGAISDDPAVVALAASLFLVAAVMQVADGVQATMLGALRGLSDTAWPAWVSMAAHWGVALPLGWALAQVVGPVGVSIGFAVALAGAAALLAWRFVRRTALPAGPPAGTLGPGAPP